MEIIVDTDLLFEQYQREIRYSIFYEGVIDVIGSIIKGFISFIAKIFEVIGSIIKKIFEFLTGNSSDSSSSKKEKEIIKNLRNKRDYPNPKKEFSFEDYDYKKVLENIDKFFIKRIYNTEVEMMVTDASNVVKNITAHLTGKTTPKIYNKERQNIFKGYNETINNIAKFIQIKDEYDGGNPSIFDDVDSNYLISLIFGDKITYDSVDSLCDPKDFIANLRNLTNSVSKINHGIDKSIHSKIITDLNNIATNINKNVYKNSNKVNHEAVSDVNNALKAFTSVLNKIYYPSFKIVFRAISDSKKFAYKCHRILANNSSEEK